MTMTTAEHILCAMKLRCGVEPGSRVGVALSGGADSVALLVALVKGGYQVVALHCDFNLRGDESKGDEQYCRDLAARLGIDIEVLDVDTMAARRSGESIEMACRRIRYEWFESEARRLNLICVAIAHHREDCVETLMLNLLRGTGTAGLAGIRPRRGIFVRPMLDLGRADIENYLHELGMTWRTDSSNLHNDYRRNVLRNLILPEIEKYFPDATTGILTTSRNMAEAEAMLESRAEEIAESGFHDGSLRVDSVDTSDMLVRCVRICFGRIINHSVAADILSRRLDRSALFPTDNGSVMLELSRGRLREVAAGQAAVDNDNREISFGTSESVEVLAGDLAIRCSIITVEEFNRAPKTGDNLYLDLALLRRSGAGLCLSHPLPGQRMRPYGMKGSRLLSDMLKEAGVAPSARPLRWIVKAGDDVLWLVGIRASALYAVGSATTQVLWLSVNR